MSRFLNRFRILKTKSRRVSFAPAITSIIVMAAGLFSILKLYALTTQTCREHLDWHLAGYQTGTSLIQGFLALCLALSAYWLADIVRPKPHRVAYTIRVFQFLLIASMCIVTFIHWGMLLPRAPHADQARQVQLILDRTPFFHSSAAFFYETDENRTLPIARPEVMAENSPFLVKGGLMRCEVEREAEERRWQGPFYPAPIAITDPPELP